MTTCLPLTALWWYPDEHGNGPRRISAPDGLPIHATMSGRVTLVDSQAVGTVVIRDEQERFHHYRRLQSSSITVSEHDVVEGGQILGVVAAPSDDSMPLVFYGVQRSDDTWVDVVDLLLGATDPADLGLRPDLVEASAQAPQHSAAASAPGQTSASKSARVRAREAAARKTAAAGQDPATGVEDPTDAAPRPDPSSTQPPSPAPPAPAPPAPDVPAPQARPEERPSDAEPEAAAPPKRSPLAARRPRRGNS